MTEGRAAVVVVAGPRKPALDTLLGDERSASLRAELVRRAVAWAAEVGEPYLAPVPGSDALGAGEGIPIAAQGDGPLGERLARVCAEVFARHGGPVVMVGVDTPQIRPAVGHAAVDDLMSGTDVTFGPASAGGYYLIGLRTLRPEVFTLPPEVWGGPHLLERSLAAAQQAGLSLGMLRAERRLEAEGDVRAFLADPLTPPEIGALLRA